MKKAIMFGILAVFVVSLVAVGAFALPSDKEEKFQNNMHSEIQTALGAGDYEAWLAALDNCPRAEQMKEVITADNFDTFVQMHQAKQDKDWETVNALAEELGIEKPERKGLGKGCSGSGQGQGRMHRMH